jgi:hypothetical protein
VQSRYTSFREEQRLAAGSLQEVALAARAALAQDETQSILTFDDATGSVVDLDLRGDAEAVAFRYAEADLHSERAESDAAAETAPRGRGRPRLGVVAREVTLLPRHWDWLAGQSGGASTTLRRLVDEARRADGGRGRARAAQEAAYRFMSAMAGNRPGFEEASRALFAGDRARFAIEIAGWPADIRDYASRLGWTAEEADPA